MKPTRSPTKKNPRSNSQSDNGPGASSSEEGPFRPTREIPRNDPGEPVRPSDSAGHATDEPDTAPANNNASSSSSSSGQIQNTHTHRTTQRASRMSNNQDANRDTPRETAVDPELQALLEGLSINGPEECGIAAGIEKSKDLNYALPVNGKPGIAAAWAAKRAIEDGIVDMDAIRTICAYAFLCVKERWYDKDCNLIRTTPDLGGPATQKQIRDVLKDMGPDHAQTGVTLAAATKVTFWQTNHHVGQGGLTGYIAKVATIKLNAGVRDNPRMVTWLWAMGHWTSTAGVWGALQVKGMPQVPGFNNFPGPTADITMRLNSYPSCTAKVGVCMAIVRRMFNGVYLPVLPPLPGLSELLKTSAAVLEDPVKYHQAYGYLFNGKKREEALVDEELMNACAAYIHATGAKSTLAFAKVLPSKESIMDHPVFTLVASLSTRLMTEKYGREDKVKILMATGGVTDSLLNQGVVFDERQRGQLGIREPLVEQKWIVHDDGVVNVAGMTDDEIEGVMDGLTNPVKKF